MQVISDHKLQVADANLALGHYFLPDVVSTSDYYPYGMEVAARSFSAGGYRYGFQGQETDDEFLGGAVSYKYRVHDARIGRFLSRDPLAAKYSQWSPYSFSGNRVIDKIELEGLEFDVPPLFKAAGYSIHDQYEGGYRITHEEYGNVLYVPSAGQILNILSYTDADDYWVVITGGPKSPSITFELRLGDRTIGQGTHLDGSPVTNADLGAMAAGEAIPFVSGHALSVLFVGGVFDWLRKKGNDLDDFEVFDELFEETTEAVSKRLQYMGSTPGKSSKTGQGVIARMKEEGKIRTLKGETQFMASDNKWYPMEDADMAHIESAVSWWNHTGRYYGPKSDEVRKFMRDEKNYYLEHYSPNRKQGGESKETYLPPAKK